MSGALFPEPEFTSRDEVPAGFVPPAVVASLAADARDAGWQVRVQFSRGSRPHSVTGRPLKVCTYSAVRMARWSARRYAYAVHDGTAWCDVVMWGPDLPPFTLGGVTDLRAFLADPGKGATWFGAIRERVADQDARAKQRVACNAGRHDDVIVIESFLGGAYMCRTCENSWPVGADPWRVVKAGTSEGR